MVIRDSGFGIRSRPRIPNPKSQIPTRDSSHAHCVCVVGKTTVCRVFSCQRTSSIGAPPRTPARSLAGPLRPAPLPRSSLALADKYSVRRVARCIAAPIWRREAAKFSKTVEPASRAGAQGPPRGMARGNRAPLNKVENTGLEPVTSWLQTRRSPS